jgi:S-DNA-T family DNA segregation ATPase FtsK/SpoIIIE
MNAMPTLHLTSPATSSETVESDDGSSSGKAASKGLTTQPDTPDVTRETSAEHAYPEQSQIPTVLRQALLQVVDETGASAISESDKEVALSMAYKLQAALVGYGMQAVLTKDFLTSTPNGVIVRFKGHDTLTVKKVSAKKDELKSTHALDVIDARTGLGEVIFYVSRPDRKVVSLADVWLRASWPSSAPNHLTSLLVGTRVACPDRVVRFQS